jgi:hypothetical protein
MSTIETNTLATKETMAEIALLANAVVSITPLSVEDLNNRIDRISESAGVTFIVTRQEVKKHVDQRRQGCGALPLANDLAYRSL